MPIGPDNFLDPPKGNQTRRGSVVREDAEEVFLEVHENAPYTSDYKEQCFQAWYKHDKPRGKELQTIIPEDEYGRKAKNTTLMGWRRGQNGWNVRAKELDIEVQEAMDTMIVMTRIEMFERHAEVGAQLVDLGLNYLETFDIASDSVAIKAIREGSDLERKSLGIDEFLKSIATMSDKQLEKRAKELEEEEAEQLKREEIIEGVVVEIKENAE